MRVQYGWVVVAAGMLSTCVGMGAVFSLAVFLKPITEATSWSRTGVSTAMTLVFLAMGFASFGWGILSDRYGARVVVMAGGILQAIGMVLASRAQSLIEFQLTYGIIVGIAGGAYYAPLMAVASGWHDRHRSLAVALISAGMGVAPLTVAPTAQYLITAYEWRPAMMMIGIGVGVILTLASLFIKQAPAAIAARGAASATPSGIDFTPAQAFRTPQFIAIALTHFACCVAHSGPIFHMVAYAMGCGIAPMAAVSVYGVAGLSGLAGRLILGISADKYGAKPVLVAGLIVQACAAGAYIFVGQLGEFYALAVVFAIAYGGVMPLYAILVRDYFGLKIMGTLFGAVSAAASIGMAVGPWAGGLIFDTFASYGWLYIGSFGVGLGAVAIALTFKPVPRNPPAAGKLQPA